MCQDLAACQDLANVPCQPGDLAVCRDSWQSCQLLQKCEQTAQIKTRSTAAAAVQSSCQVTTETVYTDQRRCNCGNAATQAATTNACSQHLNHLYYNVSLYVAGCADVTDNVDFISSVMQYWNMTHIPGIKFTFLSWTEWTQVYHWGHHRHSNGQICFSAPRPHNWTHLSRPTDNCPTLWYKPIYSLLPAEFHHMTSEHQYASHTKPTNKNFTKHHSSKIHHMCNAVRSKREYEHGPL